MTKLKLASLDEFKKQGGREISVRAVLSEASPSFETAEQLVDFLKASFTDSWETLYKHATYRSAAVTAENRGPTGTNGLPRMLKLSAFIAHGGGIPNRNRDAFIDADLEEAVNNKLFNAPYFGMIDYNHDFNAYGVWYDSRFALDPQTNTNGIQADGALFAWRYNELADRMLAQQQRQGFMDVSMTCMPGWTEPGVTAAGESFEVIRKPIFFTTSLLTVPKGDAGARAIGTEESGTTTQELESDLAKVAEEKGKTSLSPSDPDLNLADTSVLISLMEDSMTIEQLVEAVRQAVSEDNKAQFDELVKEALKLPSVQAELAKHVAKVSELETTITTLKTEKSNLETKVEEARMAKETAESALTTANTELETLREFKKIVDQKEVDAAKLAKRTARLAELSEMAIKALNTRDEATKEKLVSRWAEYEPEEWELVRDSLNSAAKGTGRYEFLSNTEGTLAPGSGGTSQSVDKIDQFIKK